MQVRTPAGEPGLRVGLDDVPSRYEAKQAGLVRTLLAAYTGTHNGHTGTCRSVAWPLHAQVYRVRRSPVHARPAPTGALGLVQQSANTWDG